MMTLDIYIAFALGMVLGWLTKIPWFLHHYRAWETERARYLRALAKAWEDKHK